VGAAEQLQDYYAHLLAVGQVWSDERGRSAIGDSVRKLTALAYPQPEGTAPAAAAPVPSKIVVVPR
jgi:hypothetical protein